MMPVIDPAEVECFRTLVAERLGLHFQNGRLDTLGEVLRRRMASAGCSSFPSYQQAVCSRAGERRELRALAEELTVGETYFFRCAGHFRAFTDVALPDRMRARSHSRQLRILSAGCASGEEAYTLAILLRHELPDLASWEVTIRGIDVNAAALGKALRARYPAWSLRDTPADVQSKFFHPDGRDFQLDAAVQSAATFEERNLLEDDPQLWQRDAFDVVFCRNVIMYFTSEAARSVIARITRSLVPGGFLFLGHAETLRGISSDFHLRQSHETFYYQRRSAEESRSVDPFPQAFGDREPRPRFIPAAVQPSDSWFDIIHRASSRIAILTDGKNGQNPTVTVTDSPPERARQSRPQPPPWDPAPALELLRMEKFAEAMALLRSLPPESQADPDTQLLLAALLTNQGVLPEAERVCRYLLQLDELNASAHYLMALCREHVGDHVGAAEHDRAAIYLDESFAMPHLHLGLAAKRSGDGETARRELERALGLLAREDGSRILLLGGGFSREALAEFCRAELRACGGGA